MTSTEKGVHNIHSKSDFDNAIQDGGLAVFDCYATWCGPCKAVAPKIVEMSNKHLDAKFYKIDVDELPQIAQELGVRAMPTFLVYKNGEKIKEIVGADHRAVESAVVQGLSA